MSKTILRQFTSTTNPNTSTWAGSVALVVVSDNATKAVEVYQLHEVFDGATYSYSEALRLRALRDDPSITFEGQQTAANGVTYTGRKYFPFYEQANPTQGPPADATNHISDVEFAGTQTVVMDFPAGTVGVPTAVSYDGASYTHTEAETVVVYQPAPAPPPREVIQVF
jgi:hypothetical protein